MKTYLLIEVANMLKMSCYAPYNVHQKFTVHTPANAINNNTIIISYCKFSCGTFWWSHNVSHKEIHLSFIVLCQNWFGCSVLAVFSMTIGSDEFLFCPVIERLLVKHAVFLLSLPLTHPVFPHNVDMSGVWG